MIDPFERLHLVDHHVIQVGDERAPSGGQDHVDVHVGFFHLHVVDKPHVDDADLPVPAARVVAVA